MRIVVLVLPLAVLATAPPLAHAPGAPALGQWTYRADPGDRGIARGWARGGFAGTRVRLPYAPNARVVTGRAAMASFRGSVGWYRTTLRVPAPGDYAVRLGSVNHHARVWVDGRTVARHTGPYLPFEARMRLAAGAHSLVVRADWRDPKAMQAAGWHRTWFNFGGINRVVTVRPLRASELDSPGIVTRLDPDGAARVSVTVRVTNRARPRTIAVAGALGHAPLRFAPVRLGAGEQRWVTAGVRIARPDLWAPGHPALHTLALQVAGESAAYARVGLRELRWDGGHLRLNGRPLRLRGASLHEDTPGHGDAQSGADMDRTIAELEAIGANATRAQHPLDPALLDRLDAAGILVWQGVGALDTPGHWTARTLARRIVAERRARLAVLAARAHPSVLAWSLGIEVAFDGFRDQRAYVHHGARELHRIDPGRPVALDAWGTHLPRRAGRLYRDVDVVGVTNYEGWYADLLAPPATVAERIRAFAARLAFVFPGKPLVVTEFGAEGNRRNPPDAPGGYRFQARLVARHVRAYERDARLSGWLAWNLRDFALRPNFLGGSVHSQLRAIRLRRGINEKGLFTYGGRAKPAARTLARLTRRA